MCVMKNNGVFIFLMCQPLKKLKNYLIFAFMIQQIIFNHLVPEMTDGTTDGRLNLGTWQGIYFYEYRNDAIIRKIDL